MPALLIAYLVSALAAMACQWWAPAAFWPYALFKPVTTALVMAYAWQRGAPGDVQRQALLAGLGLSWAFTRRVRLAARPAAFAAYAVVALGVLAVLWPGVPAALRLPVAAYVVCLAAMAAQTATVWRASLGQPHEALARRAALGGFLFLCSDALLATNRFHTPLPLSGLWILGTYWAAQGLIASALPPRR
jgi:uncharacterized membrane protein YhhN